MRDVKAALAAAPRPRPGSMLVWRLMAVSVFVVAAAGAAFSAHAHGHPGSGGSGMMMFGGSPEHVGRAVDHMLDGLNASDAQRTQIKQIATAAAADLNARRDAGQGLREQGMQIFTAPTVDAGAAEALRQQMNAQHDQASKRMLQAMLDVAKVLTPEQRARLGERMKERQVAMTDRMQRMHHERAMRVPRPASQPDPTK